MATKEENGRKSVQELIAQYREEMRMFYGILINGIDAHRIMTKTSLSLSDHKVISRHSQLCHGTGKWSHDETYKRDPRWHS